MSWEEGRFYKLANERNADALKATVAADFDVTLDKVPALPLPSLRNLAIFSEAVRQVTAKLKGWRCVIATARIRAGIKGNLLHPVATWPHRLTDFFLDPKGYEGFEFAPSAFDDRSCDKIDCEHADWIGRYYELHTLKSLYPENSSDAYHDRRMYFSWRIKRFLNKIAQEHTQYEIDRHQVDQLSARGICLVFGGTNGNGGFRPPRTNPEEFCYFLSLYFLPMGAGNTSDPSDIFKGLGQFLAHVFAAIEISRAADREGFVRDGLTLTSELVPALTDRNAAPSDTVANFLKKMTDIINEHTLGFDRQHVWVHCVAVNSVMTPDGKMTPRFEVYPHHAITRTPRGTISSFLISHPNQISAVKLIVKLWADAQAVKLSDRFINLFSDLTGIDDTFDAITKSACFSSDDKPPGFWERINIDVGPPEVAARPQEERLTQCTLGFVVENERKEGEGKPTPYAVLAFESDVPDAFSMNDIQRIHDVIKACTPLLRGLRISSAGFDVRDKIRTAFEHESNLREIPVKNSSSIPFGRFRFELLRIDGECLKAVLSANADRVWKVSALTEHNAQRYLWHELSLADKKEELPGGPDKEAQDSDPVEYENKKYARYDKTLERRARWILENERRLRDAWEHSGIADQILEFLTHIPSNIVWHCYINAVARVIAPRTDSGTGGEATFSVLQHGGRSALAMFVFSYGNREFRQIIKLSDTPRIHKEAKNYNDHVRYKILFSARLPRTGVAYESGGREATGELIESFGALISDLIAGPQDGARPETLLDRVIDLIDTHGRSPRGNIDEVSEAVRRHFTENTDWWRQNEEGDQVWVVDGAVRDNVDRLFRVSPNGRSSKSMIDELFRCLQDDTSPHFRLLREVLSKLMHSTNLTQVLNEIYHVNENGFRGDATLVRKMSYIVHGDMNGRNLIWSADHKNFSIIDFERVRVGFKGVDQLRLVFSLTSDLVDEAFRREDRGLVLEYREEVEKVIRDVKIAIAYTKSVVGCLRGTRRGEVSIPDPPEGHSSLSEVILCRIFETIGMRAQLKELWLYAFKMVAAKQLEYALRDINDSCTDALKRMRDGLGDGDSAGKDVAGSHDEMDKFNLYAYYSDDDLSGIKPTHDKFVLGKIARVLFAYSAVVAVLSAGEKDGGNVRGSG